MKEMTDMETPENDDLKTGETVEFEDDSIADVEDTEDGGAIVRLHDEEDEQRALEHFANIVDEVSPGNLTTAVNDLLDLIERDKEAREKRDKIYEEGLRRTGLGDDAPGGAQFSGANKVVHPMLVEACVDFSARVMKEIFPPNGPVRAKIVGEADQERREKAERKAAFMNWQTTEQMREFRGELEQLSTQLPLGGVQYMKLRWDPRHRRPASEFVAVDDVYLPFAATNFYTAERKTHVQYITAAEYRARVKSGMYRDVDLPNPEDPEFSKASRANDKIEGREMTSYNEDGLRTVYEICTTLDIEQEDEYRPYIITIDKSSGSALSLYRNWEPEDNQYRELDWMVEFPFVPWRGAYPIGLTHMIGGLSAAATGSLRALLDSAHIQNIPTLLKLKGGPNGQTLNVQPTEVVEIDGGGIVDDVRKLAMPLPFNGPSPTLYQLLGFLIDAGKGVVQTSFEKLSDQNPNQPVGTTVALIEQGMVVFSSIHSRMHAAMARVFSVLHRLNSAYLTEDDVEAQLGDSLDVRPSDFDGPVDIIPVSDPAVFSETQRFAQVQAIMQRAAAIPQMYNQRRVEEMFLRSMKLEADDLLQPEPGKDDMDPASENVAAAMSRPVYVLPGQDHLTHIKVHLAFLQSPMFGQNPTIIRTYLYPMAQHLRDHLLNFYLSETHRGVNMAVKKGLIEEEAEQEASVVEQVQRIIEQTLAGFDQQLAQIDQMAQQFKPQPPMPPDNTMQVAQLSAQVQQQIAQQRAQTDMARLQQQAQRDQMQAADRSEQRQLDIQREMLRQRGEDQRTALSNETRERMNIADNETAMRLAAAEIMSGEKVGVSTGTGINPGTR